MTRTPATISQITNSLESVLSVVDRDPTGNDSSAFRAPLWLPRAAPTSRALSLSNGNMTVLRQAQHTIGEHTPRRQHYAP